MFYKYKIFGAMLCFEISSCGKALCIMNYKSSFNALIKPFNAPYNALYKLMNNLDLSIHCYTLHFKFCYNYLQQDRIYYNAHYE